MQISFDTTCGMPPGHQVHPRVHTLMTPLADDMFVGTFRQWGQPTACWTTIKDDHGVEVGPVNWGYYADQVWQLDTGQVLALGGVTFTPTMSYTVSDTAVSAYMSFDNYSVALSEPGAFALTVAIAMVIYFFVVPRK